MLPYRLHSQWGSEILQEQQKMYTEDKRERFHTYARQRRLYEGATRPRKDGVYCRIKKLVPERGEVIVDLLARGTVTAAEVPVSIDRF